MNKERLHNGVALLTGNRRSISIVNNEHHKAIHYAQPRTGMSIHHANKLALKQDK